MVNIDYKILVEFTINEVYVFSASTLKFLQVNKSARENLGYTLTELQQMTPQDLNSSYTRETLIRLAKPLLENTQEKLNFTSYHVRKNKTTYTTEVHLSLMQFDDEDVFAIVIQDITEQQETEKRLIDLTLKTLQAELIQNFIRDTSHEFRNSLAILNTKVYLLSKSIDNSKQDNHIQVMQEQIKRIENLVKSLLKASVLETTNDINSISSVSPNTLITTIVSDKTQCFTEKNLTLHLNLSDDDITIYGDLDLLKTAIYNIYQNAQEFNVQNGEIEITVKQVDEFVHIIIADTGIGISKEDLPYIFDYLYRADNSRSLEGGYGLGLSIAQRIVELHGGEIIVESAVNRRTVFTLKFLSTKANV